MESKEQIVSVAEAAKLVDRNRKSIYRDIKAGRVSATVSCDNKRQIAISELIRAYGPLRHDRRQETVSETVSMPQQETVDATALKVRIAALEAENKQLLERLGDKENNLNDLRATVRLLEYKRSGFLKRIFSVKDK